MSNDFLGFGLGLRTDHFHDVLETKPKNIDWFEIISENFMVDGGKPKYYLHAIREHYPMVMHGVSMSLGSTDPLDMDYMKRLKQLHDELQPEWLSDHLCWTGINGINTHDLLPVPYTEEALDLMVERIKQAQDYMGRQILLENPSSYISFDDSAIPEWEFLGALTERADCHILFDVNNVYVSARNHGFDPLEYIKKTPADRVKQFHLAGHTDYGDYIIDTHDHDVPDPVWELYKEALLHFGPVSTMIERDGNIPPFEDLRGELQIARKIANETLSPEQLTPRYQEAV
ncbi:MNIO family bufferin maturase [Aliamphritea spongicola]|uniref:MNIO family bufferin maturase n=1 Tax=Aliamphritea spongicola TaxID=707589 RepID=UPI00196A612E|nr:DUF692 domain-containing protein [Aliamphritea spongicola]MBN3561902.1 DUF692 domain-containing protein [Aliamphritea spongicola]